MDNEQSTSNQPHQQIIIRPSFSVWDDFLKDSNLLPSAFELGVKLQHWYKREATSDYIQGSFRTLAVKFGMTESAFNIGITNLDRLGYVRIIKEGKKKRSYLLLPKLTEAIASESMYYAESKQNWVLHNKQLQTLYARLYVSRPTFKKLIRTYTSLPENVWNKCLKDTLTFQKRLESGQEEAKCSSKRISIIKYLETTLKNASKTPTTPSSAEINKTINRNSFSYDVFGLVADLNEGNTVFSFQFPDESTIDRFLSENHIEPFDTGYKACEARHFWIEGEKIKAAPNEWFERNILPKINQRSNNVRELQGIAHEIIHKEGERYGKNTQDIKGR